jgi:selenocysteine-specific elongation factor
MTSIGGEADEVRRIYFWMVKEKILIKISDDLAYHRKTLDEIKNRIRGRFAPGDRFGVADFKELFDLTRKHAIPLLEFLDRERFTRRQGNDRILL